MGAYPRGCTLSRQRQNYLPIFPTIYPFRRSCAESSPSHSPLPMRQSRIEAYRPSTMSRRRSALPHHSSVGAQRHRLRMPTSPRHAGSVEHDAGNS